MKNCRNYFQSTFKATCAAVFRSSNELKDFQFSATSDCSIQNKLEVKWIFGIFNEPTFWRLSWESQTSARRSQEMDFHCTGINSETYTMCTCAVDFGYIVFSVDFSTGLFLSLGNSPLPSSVLYDTTSLSGRKEKVLRTETKQFYRTEVCESKPRPS